MLCVQLLDPSAARTLSQTSKSLRHDIHAILQDEKMLMQRWLRQAVGSAASYQYGVQLAAKKDIQWIQQVAVSNWGSDQLAATLNLPGALGQVTVVAGSHDIFVLLLQPVSKISDQFLVSCAQQQLSAANIISALPRDLDWRSQLSAPLLHLLKCQGLSVPNLAFSTQPSQHLPAAAANVSPSQLHGLICVALSCRRLDASFCPCKALLSLPQAQQLAAEHVLQLLTLALNQPLAGNSCLPLLVQLPAARSLPLPTILQLARTATRTAGLSSILQLLPSDKILAPADIADLARCAMQNRSLGNYKLILQLSPAQKLAAQQVLSLMNEAIDELYAADEAMCLLLQLPAASRIDPNDIRSFATQKISRYDLFGGSSLEGLQQLLAMPQARHWDEAGVTSLLQLAVSVDCPGGVALLGEFLPAAQTIQQDEVFSLVEQAIQRSQDGCLEQLLLLPPAQQLSAQQVAVLLAKAVKSSDFEVVCPLLELPASPTIPPTTLLSILQDNAFEVYEDQAIVQLFVAMPQAQLWTVDGVLPMLRNVAAGGYPGALPLLLELPCAGGLSAANFVDLACQAIRVTEDPEFEDFTALLVHGYEVDIHWRSRDVVTIIKHALANLPAIAVVCSCFEAHALTQPDTEEVLREVAGKVPNSLYRFIRAGYADHISQQLLQDLLSATLQANCASSFLCLLDFPAAQALDSKFMEQQLLYGISSTRMWAVERLIALPAAKHFPVKVVVELLYAVIRHAGDYLMMWDKMSCLPAVHKLQKRQVLQLLQFACLKGSSCGGFMANALLELPAAAKFQKQEVLQVLAAVHGAGYERAVACMVNGLSNGQVFELLQLGMQSQSSTAVLQCLVKLPCAQGLSARRVGALLSSAATAAHQLLPGLCSLPAANELPASTVYNLMSACAAALHMPACILGLAGLKGAQSLSAVMLQKVLQACLVSQSASASVAVGALLGLPAAEGLVTSGPKLMH